MSPLRIIPIEQMAGVPIESNGLAQVIMYRHEPRQVVICTRDPDLPGYRVVVRCEISESEREVRQLVLVERVTATSPGLSEAALCPTEERIETLTHQWLILSPLKHIRFGGRKTVVLRSEIRLDDGV